MTESDFILQPNLGKLRIQDSIEEVEPHFLSNETLLKGNMCGTWVSCQPVDPKNLHLNSKRQIPSMTMTKEF